MSIESGVSSPFFVTYQLYAASEGHNLLSCCVPQFIDIVVCRRLDPLNDENLNMADSSMLIGDESQANHVH